MPFFHKEETLEQVGEQILDSVWQTFPALARNQLAMTWIVYDQPVMVNTGGGLSPDSFWERSPRGFSYRGVERIYPASVIKLFYLVAIHEWIVQDMIQPTPELDRAVRDMIVDSSNDATSLVMDMLSGTTSGPELPPGPFETWKYQRNIVNRYLQSLNWEELATINANHKTWCDGAYGREQAFLGEARENRNMLTTEATARLLHSIIGGVAVSAERSQAMMALMKRSLHPADLAADPENQVIGFLGAALPQSATLWSKAGLTSTVRHDAAYVELSDALPYQLIVFTEGKEHSTSEAILPFISQRVTEAMQTGAIAIS
jgi:hypothetical protein